MERIWAIGVLKGSNSVAFGFDEGMAVVKIGGWQPGLRYHASIAGMAVLDTGAVTGCAERWHGIMHGGHVMYYVSWRIVAAVLLHVGCYQASCILLVPAHQGQVQSHCSRTVPT